MRIPPQDARQTRITTSSTRTSRLRTILALLLAVFSLALAQPQVVTAQQQQQQRSLEDDSSTASTVEKTTNITTRIVGGNTADPGEYPWFVSPTGNFFCGGTLITPDIVLTAAHCDLAYPLDATVFIGGYLRNSRTAGVQQRTVQAFLPHPLYDEKTVSNDFMLVKLNAPVTTITPIVLNQNPDVPAAGATLTTMGYGYTEDGGSVSIQLNEVQLNAVSHRDCRTRYAGVTQINESIMVCAGYSAGGRGSCQGDSGGPLISASGTQVGIVSFGVGCAQSGFPGVYSRVSGAYDWITDGICALSANPPPSCPVVNTPTPAPTPAGPSPSVDDGKQSIKIVNQYDSNPEESSFIISKGGRQIYQGPDYVPEPNTKYSTLFKNFPTGEFVFTMRDQAGNGMGAGRVKGYFQIWQVLKDGTDLLLAEGDDNFFWSSSVRFTVQANPQIPDTPTPGPTPPPLNDNETLCSCAWDATSCLPSVCDAFRQDQEVCQATTGCVWTDSRTGDDDDSDSFLVKYGLYIVIAAAVVGLIIFGIVLWKHLQRSSEKRRRSGTVEAAPPPSAPPARNHKERVVRPDLNSMNYAAATATTTATATSSWSPRGSGIDVDGLAYEDV